MTFTRDTRVRAALLGVAGASLGVLLAQGLFGTPSGLRGTSVFGGLVGLCLGAALTGFSVVGTDSIKRVQRALVIGAAVGLLGGMLGATIGQLAFAATTKRGSGEATTSLFSREMKERLQDAGAKAGEIEIGLIWENQNDLDLHVVDPNGERVHWANRRSRSGGELDVDRNAGCQHNVTDKPVEHVVWPEGQAPSGDFRIYVHHFADCGPIDPTPFRVELVAGGKRNNFSGSTSQGEEPVLVHTFQWAGGVSDSFSDERGTPSPRGAIGIGSVIARVLGWMIFGALVGAAQGLVRRSSQALRNAALGGAMGAGLGAIVFMVIGNWAASIGASDALARLLGMAILGGCVGLFMVLVERALSAMLAVRSGRYEGREIFLDKPVMRIGRNETLEVFLGGDPTIAAHHATVRTESGGFTIESAEGPVLVNGTSSSRRNLQEGDTIQLGNTRMVFRNRLSLSRNEGQTATSQEAERRPAMSKKLPPPPPPPSRRPPKH